MIKLEQKWFRMKPKMMINRLTIGDDTLSMMTMEMLIRLTRCSIAEQPINLVATSSQWQSSSITTSITLSIILMKYSTSVYTSEMTLGVF